MVRTRRALNRKCTKRRCNGATIGFAVAIVVLIVMLSLLLSLLLVNSGSSILYQEKLGRINQLASSFAASHAQDGNLQEETQSYVQDMMSLMGLNVDGTTVSILQTTTNNVPSIKVTITNRFNLIGMGDILPRQVTLMDSETAAQQTSN